jgi:hypothetical protein
MVASMYCRIAEGLAVICGAALAVSLPMIPLASPVFAQTLTDPSPPAKSSPPQPGAKSRPSVAAKKSCSVFGPGFVNVPGTDACVRIGGWVEMQAGTSGH